ncbi:LysR family transcriptional regulator [Sulfuriflexus mobilis]|uniref:LysR family transcriptional regulator n=1 Tax=Sulfuriflexus mobilis TaxID=1811807 RepID=UPI00155904FD|nr:LysR family transcriptional regulator [Sulfuriflexus mobilis]
MKALNLQITGAIMHHMDWDNLRFFLTVARKGSLRAASEALSVNHSTVSRRITSFEKKLGVRLFERLPNGYVLTPTGEEMLKSAQHIEDEVVKLDRQVIGRDAQLNGVLRVTMPTALATHLLMPDISAFTKMYPNIQLELAFSSEEFNLRKREADIAIRLTPNPPDYLVGRRVLHPAKGVYASHDYLKSKDLDKHPDKLDWIGWEEISSPTQWNKDSRFSLSPVVHKADDLLAQLEAVKANMGIAMLPCFLADTVPSLERLELISSRGTCGDLWVLTHEDLRATARVRAFIDFMLEAFERHRDLLEGRRYTRSLEEMDTIGISKIQHG